MVEALIKSLDFNLHCEHWKLTDKQVVFEIHSLNKINTCPFCKEESKQVHSIYQREIQDLPLQGRQVILLLNSKRLFCKNPKCVHKTFSESFDFVAPNATKTRRLIEKILVSSLKTSAVSATALLKSDSINVCKSSICDLIKKNA